MRARPYSPRPGHQARLRLGAVSLACLVAAALAAAPLLASDWPMHRRDPQRTGNSPEALKLPLELAWSKKTGEMGIFASPVVADGVVYVGSRENGVVNPKGGGFVRPGALYAYDAKTGDLKWKLDSYEGQRLQWLWAGPTVTADALYFTNYDGYLYKVSKEGKVVWRFKTGGTDTSSPLVVDGVVYFGSAYPNTELYAVDAVTGRQRWKTTTNPENLVQGQSPSYVYSSPALAGELVVVGANNGLFFGIDRKAGEIRWRYDIKNMVYFYTPAVIGSRAILAAGHYDRTVSAVDIRTGQTGGTGWKYESDLPKLGQVFVSSPATDGKTVYIGMGWPEHLLYAIDLATGKRKWKTSLGFAGVNDITSSPALTGDYIIVGAGAEKFREDKVSGRLLVLRKSDGEVVKSFPTPAGFVASPAISNGMVFIGSLDGTLYAYKAAGFTEPKVSPTRQAPVPRTRPAAARAGAPKSRR